MKTQFAPLIDLVSPKLEELAGKYRSCQQFLTEEDNQEIASLTTKLEQILKRY